MIYYFSGTGNSREVAKELARHNNDEAINIISHDNTSNVNHDVLGFVFPIYAWGLPKVMCNFIRQLKIQTRPTYIFMVCTCGDDIGRTDREMASLLAKKGLELDAAWSVVMPNTYVALPGFDIDPITTTQRKIAASYPRLQLIAQQIRQRTSGIRDVKPGVLAGLKSYVLRPLFHLFLTGDHKFKVHETCIHCGKCAAICPMHNISYDQKSFPQWQGHCADCLACYHCCPKHSISFGSFTRRKGQYLFSNSRKSR